MGGEIPFHHTTPAFEKFRLGMLGAEMELAPDPRCRGWLDCLWILGVLPRGLRERNDVIRGSRAPGYALRSEYR